MARTDAHPLELRLEKRLRSSCLGSAEVTDRVVGTLGEVRGLQVLDVGCGTGQLCRRLVDAGASAAGLDPCASLLSCARRTAPAACFVRGHALDLPFGPGRFDVVTSVLVLHYLEDARRALGEIVRVLRPGGRLLLCDRICSSEPGLRSAQMGIERLRNPFVRQMQDAQELHAGLDSAGFRVEHLAEFAQSESRSDWMLGTDPADLPELRREIARLEGRDLGGLRLPSADHIELRMALLEARLKPPSPVSIRD